MEDAAEFSHLPVGLHIHYVDGASGSHDELVGVSIIVEMAGPLVLLEGARHQRVLSEGIVQLFQGRQLHTSRPTLIWPPFNRTGEKMS